MSEQLAAKAVITTEDLKEFLECPVCLRIPRSAPIFQCDRGHVVCNECHPKLVTCPVCRLPLGNTRSLISEKVLSRMPATCKFNDHGCEVEMMKDLIGTHESECPFRLINCVDLACQYRIPFLKLIDHVENGHEREDFVNADGATYTSHFIVHEGDFSREIMWISDRLILDGKHFFRECCRNLNGLWYIWVYMHGSRKEAKEYTYKVTIYSDGKDEELIYRGHVVSLDTPKESMAVRGSALIFPDATARRFWRDHKINYTVEVMPKNPTNESKGTSSKTTSSEESTNTNNSTKKDKPERSSSTTSAEGAVKPENPDGEDVKETPC